ncbi:MAG: DUF2786 domain-containing protein [Candidatus Latescibacteria bacterium]|jgi:hypothetical protein|nr:DUF2786 domain-containing protein [Candidatus Latescibacterota bacterium]
MPEAETIEDRLRETWNRKLYAWWNHYNDEYAGGALRTPVIGIGGALSTLGHWDGTRRTLTISEAHIRRDPWLAVMDTLRHEMAHQYVQEVLGNEDDRPHGPAFREACHTLRCVPRPRAALDDLHTDGGAETEEARIFRVLRKVLSLADSPNENEAQVAVQKARHLLMKYNVDLVELDAERRFEVRCLGDVKGRHPSYELWLASILSGFFFVEVIWANSYDARRDQKGTVLQIHGTRANLDMAEYVHDYLRTLLDRLWEEYRAGNGLTGNRERQRYFTGVLEGFHDKLQGQDEVLRTSTALVWKGDARLQAFYRYINPRVQTRYGGGVTQTQAYRDGVSEGRRVTIHKPVAGSGGGLRGYLE